MPDEATEGVSATKFIQAVDGMPSDMQPIDDIYEDKDKKSDDNK